MNVAGGGGDGALVGVVDIGGANVGVVLLSVLVDTGGGSVLSALSMPSDGGGIVDCMDDVAATGGGNARLGEAVAGGVLSNSSTADNCKSN